ncbi:butyrophilin subfamily 2 member A2-like [Myripristis murdjan]|uniref:butyrophilin subfamily 2 member A2-like n=1 Tax=Myripristis murdjan TaxID=586833 RepID=UPI001175DFAB|nr:butyrophilin subfamily 2 member A2-like [Myripristis murdjan]
MISSILLLLLVLTSSVCGKFTVSVSQTFYQAVENSNIMMEWTFSPIIPLSKLDVYCAFWLSDHRTSKILYHLQGGVEHPKSQDEQFAGRARWDREDLRKGLVRLHLSRLSINDSGIYRCEVFTEGDGNGGFNECFLNVTAAKHLPAEPKEGEDGAAVNIGVVIGAVIGSLVVLVALLVAVVFAFRLRHSGEQVDPDPEESAGVEL